MRFVLAILAPMLACACQQAAGSPARPSGSVADSASAAAAPRPTSDPSTAVIVELFSSEGCSSCPPADAFLADLERTQAISGVTVVALEEHVDYWDDLGWRDPFSQPLFSSRQRQYARVLADHSVYTPELVIDGHAVLDRGSASGTARALRDSAATAHANVRLARDADRLEVSVSEIPVADGGDVNEVWLALTEHGLSTRVPRGENAGRTLAHASVVRALRKLGDAGGSTYHVIASIAPEPGWSRDAVRAVVFVQRASSRRIVGAGAI